MHLCIVGTGYVGLVSAACFAEMGNQVICVDIKDSVIKALQSGKVHIFEPGLEDLVKRNCPKRLHFTTSLVEGLKQAQFVFICVGTPPKEDGSCDLTQVETVAKAIGQNMQQPLIIVNKSTVPVGTADLVQGLIAQALTERNLKISFQVVSNPEFLKEGDAVADFMKPDRVIVGTSSTEAAQAMRELYAPFARNREKLITMSVRSAEMTKYAANCLLATKISFINEIATLCEQVGADVREVRPGIGSDHRIGHHFIYPGLGYGGSCFPKDVKALIHTGQQIGLNMDILQAVEAVNAKQKTVMAKRIIEHFGSVQGKTLALWGLAFKANTDDLRESPALTIIELLTAKGMKIRAFDPEAGAHAKQLLAHNQLVSIEDDAYSLCNDADALLITTEWNEFRNPDFLALKKLLKTPVVFDGRNLYSEQTLHQHGFSYYCIGKQACI